MLITPKIIIHVGLHKSGSTFLREKVFKVICKSNRNILYNPPEILKILNEDFIKNLVKKKPINQKNISKKIRIYIKKLSSQTKKIIISEDNLIPDYFFSHNEYDLVNHLKLLKKFFQKPMLIIFFRKPSNLIKSLYKQEIFTRNYITFEKYLINSKKYRNLDVKKLSFKRKINFIKNNFKNSNMIFFFENNKNNINKIANYIDKKFNVKKINHSKKINPSLSNLSIYLLLKIKIFFKIFPLSREVHNQIYNYLYFRKYYYLKYESDKLKLFIPKTWNFFINFLFKYFNINFLLKVFDIIFKIKIDDKYIFKNILNSEKISKLDREYERLL